MGKMKQYPFYPSCYYDTFKDFLDGISAYGDKPAVCTFDRAGEPTVRSFRQLCLDVASLRKYLTSVGLDGKRAVIAGENSYEWIVAFFAVVTCGGVAICVDINQDNPSIAANVRLGDGDYAFTNPEYQEAIEGSLRCGDGAGIFHLQKTQNDRIMDVERMISKGSSIFVEEEHVLSSEASCAILFTSGTTADSKAVSLSQKNLLYNAAGAMAVSDLGNNVYSGLPLFHAYGLTCGMLHTLIRGAMLTVSSDIRFMMRDAFQCEAVTVFAVPLILEALLSMARNRAKQNGLEALFDRVGGFSVWKRKHLSRRFRKELSKLRLATFGKLEMVVSGGAYMNEDVCRKLQNFGILVFPGYGITECSPLVAVNRTYFYDTQTVGTVLPGYEVKFEEEEILLRGPCVMQGYYKNEKATREAIDAEGWFHTGDLGCFSKDGNLVITGRKKSLIVFQNGNKISPERIEAAMLNCPLVAEVRAYAAHFGISKDEVGIAVTVYPDPDETAKLQQYEILNKIQKYVDGLNAAVPSFQQIRIINLRQVPFERTATGKIKSDDR